MTTNEGSDEIAQLLARVADGDNAAATHIWDEFFPLMMSVARRNLARAPDRGIIDDNAVAASAMKSFFRGARDGRFSKIQDTDDLWKLLLTLTIRKANKQKRRMYAAKRLHTTEGVDVAQLPHQSGFGLLALDMARAGEELLEGLSDSLRRCVTLRIEGHTNEEIANTMSCSESNVKRKLRHVRDLLCQDKDG